MYEHAHTKLCDQDKLSNNVIGIISSQIVIGIENKVFKKQGQLYISNARTKSVKYTALNTREEK